MNILYIVARPLQINTSASIRNKATIRGLIELGHNVHLITTQYDSNHQNYDYEDIDYVFKNLYKITYIDIGGVQNTLRVGRKLKIPKWLKEFIYKSYIKFAKKNEIYDTFKGMINKINEIEINLDDYDIIITSSDPKTSHLFGIELLKSYNCKTWIQIWGDPFFSDITFKNKRIADKVKYEEKRLLDAATKIVYVSPITKEMQMKLYPENSNKMNFVPSPYLQKMIYEFPNKLYNKNLTFLYCGDYLKDIRNIMPLYDAINQSKHKLIICGSTDIKLKENNNVSIYPRVSFNQVKKFEAECDVLVHLSNLHGSQIPGKIYQYSGTNKPILFILDGDKEQIKNSFEMYNRYVFCDNNSQNIKMSIEQIKESLSQVENKPIADFSPKEVAKGILDTLLNK